MLLREGMKGPDVANLQRVLAGLGTFKGFEADGDFGPKTVSVVKTIQKNNGLVADGIVGNSTFKLLDKLFEPDKQNFSSSDHVPQADVKSVVSAPTGRLAGVHPALAAKAQAIIDMAKAEGYDLMVTQGLRTFAEQDRLYRKRPRVTRARGGQSSHNYGVAVDFAFKVNGKLSWDTKLYKNIGRWANQVGLTWGGNWKFTDLPHVQLAETPHYSAMLDTYNKGGKGDKGVNAVWSKYFKGLSTAAKA